MRLSEQTSRRTRRRKDYRAQVQIVCGEELVGPPRWTRDLSAGGIGLDRVDVPTFSQVLVFLPLPDGSGETRTVIVEGELAWRRLGGTGIRFCEPPPAEVLAFLAS